MECAQHLEQETIEEKREDKIHNSISEQLIDKSSVF